MVQQLVQDRGTQPSGNIHLQQRVKDNDNDKDNDKDKNKDKDIKRTPPMKYNDKDYPESTCSGSLPQKVTIS